MYVDVLGYDGSHIMVEFSVELGSNYFFCCSLCTKMWVRKVGRRGGRVETLDRRREGRKSESLSSPCPLKL